MKEAVNITSVSGLWLVLCFIFFVSCQAQDSGLNSSLMARNDFQFNPTDSVFKETHTYDVRFRDTLELDVFQPARHDAPTPCVIFVHGGGFFTGTRKEKNIEHFCDSLARNGLVAINISYHLYLKGQSFHCDQASENKVAAFASAVNDLRRATAWVITHAEQLHIDPHRIYLAGSSAGAETVLHAAYWPQNSFLDEDQLLQDSFKYRGVMAFAGALVDTNLIDQSSMIPTLLYHGSCDPLVPYGSATHHYCPEETVGALLLHGSYSIYQRMSNLDATVRLVTACGGKHGSAVTPIERDIKDILDFIRRIENGIPFNEHEVRGKSDCRYGDWDFCAESNSN